MFRDNKFRFTLQWGIESEEKLVAGQLLEKLGNKKSEFVIIAVSEYIRAHPEVAAPESKVSITIQPTQTNAQLMDMVKGMAKAAVEELMAGMTGPPVLSASGNSGPSSDDLVAMLDNLDVFK